MEIDPSHCKRHRNAQVGFHWQASDSRKGCKFGNKNVVGRAGKTWFGQRRCCLKITWIWSDFFNKLLRLEELTPEEHLLLSVEAPNYGPEVESQWEEATRRGFEDQTA